MEGVGDTVVARADDELEALTEEGEAVTVVANVLAAASVDIVAAAEMLEAFIEEDERTGTASASVDEDTGGVSADGVEMAVAIVPEVLISEEDPLTEEDEERTTSNSEKKACAVVGDEWAAVGREISAANILAVVSVDVVTWTSVDELEMFIAAEEDRGKADAPGVLVTASAAPVVEVVADVSEALIVGKEGMTSGGGDGDLETLGEE